MNEYFEKRKKTDSSFRLTLNTRRRIHHALNGESKSSSTEDLLGIDIDTFREWVEYQFTLEMNWFKMEIHNVKPSCMLDVSKTEELKKVSSWRNTQPILKHVYQQKGTEFNFLDYKLQ